MKRNEYYVKYIIHNFPLYFRNGQGDKTSGLNTEITFHMISLLKLRNLCDALFDEDL